MSESGKKKEGATISAELVLDGGVAATATFDAAPGYELNRGMFYDVEVRSKNQDGAFLQVAALPEGKSIGEVADSFFTKTNPNPNPNPNPHPHPNPEPEPEPGPNQEHLRKLLASHIKCFHERTSSKRKRRKTKVVV